MPPTADIPWPVRVRLAHAALQATASQANVDSLLIKGYATDRRLYFPNRSSTDVDILVRPSHVSRLVRELESLGWKTLTTFWSGSIFHHAQTMRHPAWGLVDIHRTFPGLDGDPEDTFEALWRSRTTLPIASYPCDVPSLLDQALVIVVHSARNTLTIHQDVAHLRSVLGPEDWDALRHRAEELGATLAFAAATGQLHRYQDHPAHDLWTVLSQGGTRSQEWRARMRAASTLKGKALVALSAPLPNIDHLRMDLEREPTRWEIAQATVHRPWLAIREVLSGRAKRQPDRSAHDDVSSPLDLPGMATHHPESTLSMDDSLGETPGKLAGLLTGGTPGLNESPGSREVPAPQEESATTSAQAAASYRDAGTEDRCALRPAPNVAFVDDIETSASIDAFSPVYVAQLPERQPQVMEGSAAVIWRVALEAEPDRVVAQVAELVELDPEDIAADVNSFLTYLTDEKLLI